jgi:hypothetical protein
MCSLQKLFFSSQMFTNVTISTAISPAPCGATCDVSIQCRTCTEGVTEQGAGWNIEI